MKKGRHRRFEEARLLKRSTEVVVEPCAECGAGPEDDHASWCLATEDTDDEVAGSDDPGPAVDPVPPGDDLATGPDQAPDNGELPGSRPRS